MLQLNYDPPIEGICQDQTQRTNFLLFDCSSRRSNTKMGNYNALLFLTSDDPKMHCRRHTHNQPDLGMHPIAMCCCHAPGLSSTPWLPKKRAAFLHHPLLFGVNNWVVELGENGKKKQCCLRWAPRMKLGYYEPSYYRAYPRINKPRFIFNFRTFWKRRGCVIAR